MYGTIARFRVKPGMEAQLMKLSQEMGAVQIPGARATYVYRLDNDPSEYYLAVIFDSKEAYHANAASPEQDARYRQLRQLLQGDPEWHDGEIVYSSPS
jgi:quinol monooxygenase YgiN